MSVWKLRSLCQVPADISLELLDGEICLNCGRGRQCRLLHSRLVCRWSSLPYLLIGEAVSALYPGTACTHTSKRLSDSYGLQCAKLSLPVGYFNGRDLFCLGLGAGYLCWPIDPGCNL